MSLENVQSFWSRANEDGPLRRDLDALLAAESPVPAGSLLALAQSHGFAFSEDELKASFESASGGELSDAELEAASAGTMQIFVKTFTIVPFIRRSDAIDFAGIISF